MHLTAVILTKNEEKFIVDCIGSLLFCDQILVIDDESTDRTVEIIKKMGNPKVHVRTRALENDFSAQRNFALTQADGEWILFVDADEQISEELAKEILEVTKQPSPHHGYYIKRDDYLWGEKMQKGETGKVLLLRLVQKGAGKWKGKVHETLHVTGTTGILEHPIIHHPHQNVSEFLREINNYSTIRAEELFAQKVKSNLFYIVAYPKMKFLKNYFFLGGYKDGMPGFIHAVIMSFHSFLVRAKLYLLWKGIKSI